MSDLAEAQRIWTLLPGDLDDHYIGASDRVTEGTYLTVTNEPQTFLPWVSGDPDGATENCLALDFSQKVLDTACNNANDYVCEYDGIPAVPAAFGR